MKSQRALGRAKISLILSISGLLSISSFAIEAQEKQEEVGAKSFEVTGKIDNIKTLELQLPAYSRVEAPAEETLCYVVPCPKSGKNKQEWRLEIEPSRDNAATKLDASDFRITVKGPGGSTIKVKTPTNESVVVEKVKSLAKQSEWRIIYPKPAKSIDSEIPIHHDGDGKNNIDIRILDVVGDRGCYIAC